jgi:hypothetical protein
MNIQNNCREFVSWRRFAPGKKGYITVFPKHKGPRGEDEETKEKN